MIGRFEQMVDELNTPSNFQNDWYGWVIHHVAHFGLGAITAKAVADFFFFVDSLALLLLLVCVFVLFYIGIKSLLNSPEKVYLNKQTHLNDISPFQAIKIGFITNILNPKATLFFLSLFTLVIGPDISNLSMIIISMKRIKLVSKN